MTFFCRITVRRSKYYLEEKLKKFLDSRYIRLNILSSIFPAGEGGFVQMMYRSLERSPQDPRDGIFLYSAQDRKSVV